MASKRAPADALALALAEVVEDAVTRALNEAMSVTGSDPESVVLVSLAEASRRLGVGLSTVKHMVTLGQLQSVKVGRRRLIPTASIMEFAHRPPERQ